MPQSPYKSISAEYTPRFIMRLFILHCRTVLRRRQAESGECQVFKCNKVISVGNDN